MSRCQNPLQLRSIQLGGDHFWGGRGPNEYLNQATSSAGDEAKTGESATILQFASFPCFSESKCQAFTGSTAQPGPKKKTSSVILSAWRLRQA